jgi:hypothetical protein
MLHDMRGSYIRRERPSFQYDAPPSRGEIVFFAVSFFVFAALLYLRFQSGMGLDDSAALYGP